MNVVTSRLELVQVTLPIVEADLHRRDELPALLDAEIAEGWPPPLMDVAAMERHKQAHIDDPALGPWSSWYWITLEPRVLIGLSGFKSRPQNGSVEIGYSLMPAYHGKGYATEAVNAQVKWAFENDVARVVAETLPELIASQRVLLKCGFKQTAPASEPGVLRFERCR
ncbi:MAG TPA: GNAT family N-acetyltransferase [Candidatus Acidoferrum sp.]|nr:GNAT family N-acetyltransferase [Candidatus Acidoferrum sp.]